MTFTAWTNSSGSFGFKVLSTEERNLNFSKENSSVNILLPDNNTYIKVVCNTAKKTFWNNTCKELIKKQIGVWFKNNHYYPWNGHPPKFEVERINSDTYKVIKQIQ